MFSQKDKQDKERREELQKLQKILDEREDEVLKKKEALE
jgi:hypothetical protein